MKTSDSVVVEAPADLVWEIYSDVEGWPSWTRSVTSVSVVGGGPLALGAEADIEQPKLPKVRWTVTSLEPGRSWEWSNRAPGATSVGAHAVTPTGEGSCRVDLSIEQRGPIGALIGLVYRGLTRRYLAMEGAGLKAAAEAALAARGSGAGGEGLGHGDEALEGGVGGGPVA